MLLEDGNAQSFAVEFVSVSFSDGTGWSRVGEVASETAVEVVKTTAKVAKATVKVANVILNAIWSFFMICLTCYGLTFVATGDLVGILTFVLCLFITVVTFPFFNKVLFKKKYGVLQRLIRWIGLPILGFIVARLIVIIFG